VFSCSKIEQVQWNTWVSFQSAQWAKLGQFSVSGNMKLYYRDLMVLEKVKAGRVTAQPVVSWDWH